MIVKRKIIEINEELCDGCGLCVPSCAEGALQIINGKARVVADKFCDGLGACLGECPTGALQIIERDAEEFDEKAVEAHLNSPPEQEKTPDACGCNASHVQIMASSDQKKMACGCPSSQIQAFVPANRAAAGSIDSLDQKSALSHWPIKIRLVPANAPFLKNADLLVMADCAAASCPNLHRDFIKNRVVLMGCPKFDEVQDYVNKFAEIFKTAKIKSITNLFMEVPCCSALPVIVQKGMDAAGVRVPVKDLVVGRQGGITAAG